MVWPGLVQQGEDGQGRQGRFRFGDVRHGEFRLGEVWQARQVVERLRKVCQGRAWLGRLGMFR